MRLGISVVVLLAGCVATETGNPSARPELDPAVVEGEVIPNDPMLPSPPMVAVRGRAGSVDPPTGQIRGWGLERTGPAAFADVDAEGGFVLYVHAAESEPVRLEVEAPDGTRSLPVDVRVSSTTGLMLAMVANDCLAMEPETLFLSTAPGRDVAIVLTNACAEPVDRSEATLRNAESAFSVIDEGPLSIPPGESSTVRVRATGAAEDIVLIRVLAPRPELRAVSVLAE